MKAYIIRTTTGKCYECCTNKAGKYEYGQEPRDIYRRHANCDCVVEYVVDGKNQNVHTKRWATEEEIEARKNIEPPKPTEEDVERLKNLGVDFGKSGGIIKSKYDTEKYSMPESKIDKFLLDPKKKHSKEFFNVGYGVNDGEKLNRDILAQFDIKKAYDFKSSYNTGYKKFSINMELGITKIKPFQTVWELDNNNKEKPRFITAYRRDVD